MFTKEFLEKYPITHGYLCQGLKARALKAMNDMEISDKFKESLAEIVMEDDHFLQVLEENPGTLFRYFDEIGVHFYIYPVRTNGIVEYTYANINDGKPGRRKAVVMFPSRVEAEKWAIIESFEMAEELLIKEVNT